MDILNDLFNLQPPKEPKKPETPPEEICEHPSMRREYYNETMFKCYDCGKILSRLVVDMQKGV